LVSAVYSLKERKRQDLKVIQVQIVEQKACVLPARELAKACFICPSQGFPAMLACNLQTANSHYRESRLLIISYSSNDSRSSQLLSFERQEPKTISLGSINYSGAPRLDEGDSAPSQFIQTVFGPLAN
jgi:hypothetical protein